MHKSNLSEFIEDLPDLVCDCCGKDLTKDPGNTIVGSIVNPKNKKIIAFKMCCKGACDKKTEEVTGGIFFSWNPLSKLLNPVLYLRYIMGAMRNLELGLDSYTSEGLEEFQSTIYALYPYVSRDITDEEKEASVKSVAIG